MFRDRFELPTQGFSVLCSTYWAIQTLWNFFKKISPRTSRSFKETFDTVFEKTDDLTPELIKSLFKNFNLNLSKSILLNGIDLDDLLQTKNSIFNLISENNIVLTIFQVVKNLAIWDTWIFNFLSCTWYSNCSWDFLLTWGDCKVEKKENFCCCCDCMI